MDENKEKGNSEKGRPKKEEEELDDDSENTERVKKYEDDYG